MRTHHLFIAIIVVSLFSIMLYKTSTELFDGLGMDSAEYLNVSTTKNASGVFKQLDVLTRDAKYKVEDTVGDMQDKAPGGAGSTLSGTDDSATAEGALQVSGLGVVQQAGIFLVKIPKLLIGITTQFFGIDPTFATSASTILIYIIVIILVSSILRNRL